MDDEEEDIYSQIKKALENIPENFNILEEQIDIEVQVKYFEFSRRLKEKGDLSHYAEMQDTLFGADAIETKREILTGLASVNDVKAYRIIEKYHKNPDPELKEWAVLAMQESRMLLQSSLLGEQQVFISTGLGGKGNNLRYHAVFLYLNVEADLAGFQKKLLEDELFEVLAENQGELEELNFNRGFATAMVVLPLKAELKEIFNSVLEEVNQYGNFLSDNIIVTNVKKLSDKEIRVFLKGYNPLGELSGE